MATYIKILKDGNNNTVLPRTRVGAITLDDGTIELADIIDVVLVYNGIKATYANLPSSDQKVGDMYYVTADSVHYFWNGTAWAIVGGGSGVASDIEFTPTGGIAATNVQTAIAELDTEKAKLASPTFTGTPKAPTATAGTNTTQIATTAFVKSATSNLMPISGGVLENYREKLTTVSASGGSINLSLGNVFQHTPSGNRTYSITNAISGQAHSFTLIINMGSTVRTLTFPASVKWQGGKIPDLTTKSKTYVLTFMTVNGGTNWLGMFGGEF